jgi:hypothetical protein
VAKQTDECVCGVEWSGVDDDNNKRKSTRKKTHNQIPKSIPALGSSLFRVLPIHSIPSFLINMSRLPLAVSVVLTLIIALLVHYSSLIDHGPPSQETIDSALAQDSRTHMVRLSHGLTRYRIYGSTQHAAANDTEVIVMVHGFASSMEMMHYLANQTTWFWSGNAPLKVLIYDLYGRGLSSAPKEPSTDALYTSQLAELLVCCAWVVVSTLEWHH